MTDLQPYAPFLVLAITGLIAGWLSGLLLGGGGLIRNLIVGCLGAMLGGLLQSFGLLPLPAGVVQSANAVPYGMQILVATIGAVLVVLLFRLLRR